MIKILSVPGSPRRKQAEIEVKKLNIQSWSFYDAVSIDDIDNFVNDSKNNLNGKDITKVEKSCSISHYNMIKDQSTHIILEDDFKLIEYCELVCIVNEINKKDIPIVVILGHSKTSDRDFWMQKLKQPLINKRILCGKTVGENYKINFYGAVGYIINNKFKEAMAEVNEVHWLADDWLKIREIIGCDIYQLSDKIIIENLNDDYVSGLGNKIHFRHDSRKKILINLIKALRAQVLFLFNKRYFNENSNNTQ